MFFYLIYLIPPHIRFCQVSSLSFLGDDFGMGDWLFLAIPQYRSYYTPGRGACRLRPASSAQGVILAPQKYATKIS